MAQNYNNHKRYSIPFHFITVPLILLAIGLSIHLFLGEPDLLHGLIILAFILIGLAALFARFFALKVQDRAARADEKLRYYILSGKMLSDKLSMSQILALRFASDEELVALVERALINKLSSNEIKHAIVKWRADHDRV